MAMLPGLTVLPALYSFPTCRLETTVKQRGEFVCFATLLFLHLLNVLICPPL